MCGDVRWRVGLYGLPVLHVVLLDVLCDVDNLVNINQSVYSFSI